MTFGSVPVDEATGGILAHALRLPNGVLKKGTVLQADHIKALTDAGLREVVVAQLSASDLLEDEAAQQIGEALISDGFRLGAAFTGRSNVIAEKPGVVRVNTEAVKALNAIDEGLTLATLPDLMRVDVNQLVGTVKIIPYGLQDSIVEAGLATLGRPTLSLHPFEGGTAQLVMTVTPGFKKSLLKKGEDAVRARLETLNYSLTDVATVPHETGAVAAALTGTADLTLILGASATSDRADVAPAALIAAGGRIDRFGMPVDPGNLIFLGELNRAPVVGLPGCARSPALNGVDWVLERISARIPVTAEDIAAMGVGGLLKEMPGRPQPRRPAQ
ncbi:MAG: molybdopterin-binding protein [Pseudomonadota bacterium]